MALPVVGVSLKVEGAAAFFGDLDKGQAAINAFGNASAGLSGQAAGGFSALEQVGVGALRRIGAAAVEVGAQAAQAMGAFVADSISVAGDFEASVNNLAAISGTALAEAGFSFDDVSAKALQLGQDTAYSASESIAAMTELVKGGVPVAEVMATATDATLALAAASGTELASAAEIVSKQLGVWADTGVEAGQVADLLTQAANASTVGVEDLALGLANSSGTAKTAGVNFQELVQTMALIAPGFSSASDAGTSLKTMISRLQPTTKPATDAMIGLGLATADGTSKFYDAQGSFIGMEKAAGLLHNATKDLSEAERVMAFQTIFGSDAIRAAAYVAEAGSEGFNAMGESMAAAGTAADVAAIQNQGFNFAMDSLKGSIETVQIVIGGMLLPVLTSLINGYLIPGVGVFNQFAQAIGGNQEAFAALSPQLQSIVTGISAMLPQAQAFGDMLIANWQPILATVGGLLTALLVPALAAGAASMGAAVVAAAPVIAILAGVGAASAALAGAWQSDFGGIQGATAGAMEAVQSVVTSVISGVVSFWQKNGAAIMASAQTTWTTIQETIGVVINKIMEIITAIFGQIQEFINAHGDEISAFIKTTWDTINEIIQNITQIIKEIVTVAFGAIKDFINDHGTEIQSILDFAWNAISDTITTVLDVIKEITKAAMSALEGDWSGVSDSIKTIVETLGSFLSDQWENIKKLVEDLGPELLSAATSVGQAIVDGVAGGISAGAGAIADAARGAAQAALDAAKRALGISSPSAVFAATVGEPISEGMAQGIVEGQSTVAGAVAQVADTSLRAVQPPATVSNRTTNTYGGTSISVDARGAQRGVGDEIRGAISAALSGRSTSANTIRRMA